MLRGGYRISRSIIASVYPSISTTWSSADVEYRLLVIVVSPTIDKNDMNILQRSWLAPVDSEASTISVPAVVAQILAPKDGFNSRASAHYAKSGRGVAHLSRRARMSADS
jgi:hypothetical protein